MPEKAGCNLLINIASQFGSSCMEAMSTQQRRAVQLKVDSWGLPQPWVPIVVECLLSAPIKDLSGVEVFAGEKAVALGLGRACEGLACEGLPCATLELLDGQDITKLSGQREAINYLCRCRALGLTWLGTPCSSWIFLGRSNAGRYTWLPQGDETREYTRAHNNLANISIDLAWLAFCLGLHVVIEQPLSSILFDYAPMRALIHKTGMQRATVQLGGFGAASRKPLQLWGTVPWLSQLAQASTQRQKSAKPGEKLSVTTTDNLGRQNVTGKKAALKESSAYPPEFGRVVGELHRKLLESACEGDACKGKKRRLFDIKDDVCGVKKTIAFAKLETPAKACTACKVAACFSYMYVCLGTPLACKGFACEGVACKGLACKGDHA
jgi:hypothetical protein